MRDVKHLPGSPLLPRAGATAHGAANASEQPTVVMPVVRPPAPVAPLPPAVPSAQLRAGQAPPPGAARAWDVRAAHVQHARAGAAGPPVPEQTAAAALMAVLAGVPLDAFVGPVRAAVERLLAARGGARDTDAAARAVLTAAQGQLSPDSVRGALHGLVAAGRTASAAFVDDKTRSNMATYAPGGDRRDFHRAWGLSLLPHDTPALRDPEYLVLLNQEAGQAQTNRLGIVRTPSSARARFEDEWRKNSARTMPIALCDTGSDAVSLCFDIARRAARERVVSRLPPAARAQIQRTELDDGAITGPINTRVAHFEHMFGGARGESAGLSSATYNQDIAPSLAGDRVPSPISSVRNPTDPAELARLRPIEDEAIARLEQMCSAGDPVLGAIVLEPVLGAHGVWFYRDEFLQRVRALADRYDVPLVCDEVFTGGGRTGTFFFYEQVPGFEPDYVTFGKGLQTAGVAAVDRSQPAGAAQKSTWRGIGLTTLDGDSSRMLKATFVMKHIREHGLADNARAVGTYLADQLRAVQAEHGLLPDATGAGMMIGASGLRDAFAAIGVSTSGEGERARLSPFVTLTYADVDHVIADLRAALAAREQP